VSGTGLKDLFTVPTGKRWLVGSLAATVGSGTFTVAAMGLRDRYGNTALLLLAAEYGLLKNPMWFEEGQSIFVNVDTYAAPGSLSVSGMVLEEEDIKG